MNNRLSLFILILLLPALFSCKKLSERTDQKPNFIFILVDDLGWTDLGCYGSTFYETPNIDRLASEATRFTNAYAACPVCSPTRASIMTGKYPARIHLTDWIPGRQKYAGPQPCDKLIPVEFEQQMKLEEITIAEVLKLAGYKTFFAGKWHLGEDSIYWPEYQGFDINKGGWGIGWPDGGYFSPWVNPRLENGHAGENLTDRLTSESIKFLESVRDDPFFLYLSFYAVHTPLQTKEELIRKYERKSDSLGLTQIEQTVSDREWMRKASPEGNFKERIMQGHPIYAGMIETVDINVGRIMDALEELDLEDNTIIFFMSDNGGLSTAEGSPTSNLPLRAGKGWLYEGGIRVPMIIKWPDGYEKGSRIQEKTKHRRSRQEKVEEEVSELDKSERAKTEPANFCEIPVISTDFYPTILEMAGLDLRPDQHMDGISLVTLLEGKGTINERPIFWHYPHYSNQGGKPGAAIRLGKYKLIEFFEDNRAELYDLGSDIGEQNDLSARMPEKVNELLDILYKWQKEVDARMMDPNPGYDPGYVREN
jgi:arylsulfatase A-like enzyme